MQAATFEASGSADDTQELAAYCLWSRRRGEDDTNAANEPSIDDGADIKHSRGHCRCTSGNEIQVHLIASHQKRSSNDLLAAKRFVIDPLRQYNPSTLTSIFNIMTSRTKDGFVWTSSSSGRHGLTTEASGTSTPALKAHYDVIVIGAGFAGLTAARDLTVSRDLSVLLVEARDRVGGRTCTVKELAGEFEIGGQWVHW